ncbi:MFS transporter [Falsirhodobacter halotolerans]|uniref:MFS transporter n=1 Tax=Falsirhodobacter halotolerans TaxID=1146892 RepID=UPI001FD09FA4|nr:MFS transporter [Falsirhodobacter halotolerans]MCJ8138710.1 MFS transporter [Falsirhodobacter halotolerans]
MPHANLRAMTVFGTLAVTLFSLGASVPTPLYPLFQASYGLAAFDLTLIFGIYVVFLLAALLCGGRLSDHLGRKPVIAMALVLNLLAIAQFTFADGLTALLIARAVQGVAMGLALPTLGAAIVDGDHERGPVLNSIAPFIGMSVGALGSGVLATYAPWPMIMPFLVMGAWTLVQLISLPKMPETVPPKPGAIASLIPRLGLPVAARTTFSLVVPPVLAGWALGGLFMSLMPSILQSAVRADPKLISGATVFLLMGGALIAVLWGRKRDAGRMLRFGCLTQVIGVPMVILGVETGNIAILLSGTVIAGPGQGLMFSSAMRLLLPLALGHERAGMIALFLALSYVTMAVPAVLAGMAVGTFGLLQVALVYGAAIVAVQGVSLARLLRDARAPAPC